MAKITDSKREKMLEVLKQFRILLRSIKRHYQWVEQKCGVSGAQLWALSEIAASPGLRVSDLAQQLAIHRSTASNMLDRLESLRLVVRRRVGKDQRVVQLQLTPRGEETLRQAPRPLVGVLQQALLDLSPSSLDSLHRDLGEVIRLMRTKDTRAKGTPLADL